MLFLGIMLYCWQLVVSRWNLLIFAAKWSWVSALHLRLYRNWFRHRNYCFLLYYLVFLRILKGFLLVFLKENPSKSLGKQANVRKIKNFDVEINSCKAADGEQSLSFILQQKSSKSIYKQKTVKDTVLHPQNLGITPLTVYPSCMQRKHKGITRWAESRPLQQKWSRSESG